MNCQHFRRFLYAFADDQLAGKSATEVRDHLAACEPCRRAVEDHRVMRSALRRHIELPEIPADLAERVRSRLLAAPAAALQWRRLQGALVPAAAAVILLAVGVSAWYLWPQPNDGRLAGADPCPLVKGPGVACDVAEKHVGCCALGDAHQVPDLPRNVRDLAPALNRHFAGALAALAPDLSRFGFELASSNYCSPDGPGGQVGAHVIYESKSDQAKVSFFSLRGWRRADASGQFSMLDRAGFRQCRFQRSDGSVLSIIAWRQGATNYVGCGPVETSRLKTMARDVRVAFARFDDEVRLAMITRRPVAPAGAVDR